MSASEVIEKIKSLPPEEKAEVADFIKKMDIAVTNPSDNGSMDRAKLEATAGKIFDRYDNLFRKLAK